jgi:hypothetical protein
VVARRPSSRPAAARVKVPLQIDAIRVPAAAAVRSASRTPAGTGIRADRPGTMTVSASASASSVQCASEQPGVHSGRSSADAYAVAGASVGETDPAEVLEWSGQVERDNLVKCEHDNRVHGHNVCHFRSTAKGISRP